MSDAEDQLAQSRSEDLGLGKKCLECPIGVWNLCVQGMRFSGQFLSRNVICFKIYFGEINRKTCKQKFLEAKKKSGKQQGIN